ncbi:integral membrane protein [Colletotrichum graminicola]|nr:integral membrane protein [Colletotrichum graminicola]
MLVVEGAAPPPEGVIPNLQHPEDVLYTINLVSQILSVSVVSLFMLLRIYAKAWVSPPFHAEDWVAVLAWVLTLGYGSTAFVMSHYGGGYHIYELSKENLEGFMKLTSSLGLYADTLVYGPNSFFTKLALLMIVIRVFRFHQKTKIGIYLTIAFMAGYYVPVFFLKTFICRPIRGFWNPNSRAACLDQRAIFVADTITSAVTDLAVLILPIPAAASLRMSWEKRLKVMGMLSAGGIATAASLARMVIVIRLQETKDETVEFIRFNLLGTAEVSIGMICACFPAVNILLTRRVDQSQQSSRYTHSSIVKSLKFLGGSKLRTQHMTDVQTVTTAAAVEEARGPLPSPPRRDCIFPMERISRLPPILQPSPNSKGNSSDEWFANLCTSPFSDPGAPEWARKGSHG